MNRVGRDTLVFVMISFSPFSPGLTGGVPPLVHQFFVRANDALVKPHGSPEQNATGEETRHRVFGMTARIIVDAARLAYAQEPAFEHNSHWGDEAMIAKLRRMGRLSETRRPSDELTRETMEKAAKLS